MTVDTYHIKSGCVESRFENPNWIQCEDVHKDALLWGVRFSSAGIGIQLENSGAAAMAFSRFIKRGGDNEAIGVAKDNTINSIKRMFRAWPEGIPASFHEQRYTDSRNVKNTGFTWSYYRKEHAASTYWTALALLYDGETAPDEAEVYNPYGSLVPLSTATSAPEFAPDSSFFERYRTFDGFCESADDFQCPISNLKNDAYWKDVADDDDADARFEDICGQFYQWASGLNAESNLAVKLGMRKNFVLEERQNTCAFAEYYGCGAKQRFNILRKIYYDFQGGSSSQHSIC